MNIVDFNAWLPTINFAVTSAIGIWLYLERRNDKTNDRVSRLSSKVEQLDKDVAILKANGENAPSHNDLGNVYESIRAMEATVNQLVGENRNQTDMLRTIFNRMAEKAMS